MRYGYFDDERYEYVIDRPDTPAPWVNYLGDPNYGAILSNNAGGYSFAQSGANGRILRYCFNGFDEPGRYIYIRDRDDGDYWSASWRPVLKDLRDYQNICRHGTGYSTIEAEYRSVRSAVTYYVPLGGAYEVWYLTLTNAGAAPRRLSVTGYCEFTGDGNYEQDQVNLQYSLFITRTEFRKNYIRQLVNPNFEFSRPDDCAMRFFGMANAEISHYCGDKHAFLGNYHSYANPAGVIGDLPDALNFNGTSCGALQTDAVLAPGQTIRLAFVLGMQKDAAAEAILNRYADIASCEREIAQLKAHWHGRLSALRVHTPCREFDSMINVWHAYNCFITFTWSRAASLIYCGLRNGYGYRDTVQDIQGVIHLDPAAAREKLNFMLSAQVSNGAGLPLVKFTHNPGHEDTPDDASYVKATGHPAYRADDALWLFPTIYKYIAETGERAYLDQVIPYADRGADTVYEHLKRAIHFSLTHLGRHEMPAGLFADWNDCLRLGAAGESTFVLMQFFYALRIIREFADVRADADYAAYIDGVIEKYRGIIDGCYDEDRFIRGYTKDGAVIGAKRNREANMWLNPQSYAVIARACEGERAETVLNSVHDILSTPYGAELMYPPFERDLFDGALAACYAPGNKENGSIFQQTQGWLILAEALNGNGNRAFEYYRASCPAFQNDAAEVRVMEPYVYGQFTEGRRSPRHGRSNVHWLTGTAATVMVGCVEGILGIRPNLRGLEIQPAIPDAWDDLEIEKNYRGKKLRIRVHNHAPERKLILNGAIYPHTCIADDDLLPENDIDLYR